MSPLNYSVDCVNYVTIKKGEYFRLAFLCDFLCSFSSQKLLSTGEKWRRRRKLLTPAFHFRILEEFVPVFYEQSKILVSKLNELQQCSWIDIVPLISSCTLDIICETAMGISVNAQGGKNNEYVQAIHEITKAVSVPNLNPWHYFSFLYRRSSSGKKFIANLKIIHNFTRKVIKEKKDMLLKYSHLREKNGVRKNEITMNVKRKIAFLELLLIQHLKDPTFTKEDIREEVDTFMFEGHDTTAMSLCWTLYCIGLYKSVQCQVHQELDAIFEGDSERAITGEDIKRMKYLECVIKETLRLYPVAPFFSREAKESFEVLDYTVDRGSTCLIFPYMLHRDPETFPNPEKFDPERFFPENIAGRHPYAYVPFSAGPRNCIGQKFALKEEKTVLANILRNFSINSKDQRDKVKVMPTFVLRNLDPIRMQFTLRKKL